MKWIAIVLGLLLGTGCCLFAQKPVLDLNKIGYDHWARAQDPAISNDGAYVLYTLANVPSGSNTTYIQSAKGSWKVELPGIGISQVHFTPDSRKVIFMRGKDSLCLLSLDTQKMEVISGVLFFRLLEQGNASLLAIQKGTTLVLRKLSSGMERSYSGVSRLSSSENGKAMLLLKSTKTENGMQQELDLLQLSSGKTRSIWQGNANLGHSVFDAGGQQLAFTLMDKQGISIWYYREGMDGAELLADQNSPGIDTGLKLEGIENFSKDGSRIFVKLKEPDFPVARPEAAKVDVWSYIDPKLQSQQLAEGVAQPPFFGGGPRSFAAMLEIGDRRLIRLEQEGERIDLLDHGGKDTLAILEHTEGNLEERYWSSAGTLTYTLISTRTGERKVIHINETLAQFFISPDGQYLLYQGSEGNDLFSYEIVSGLTRNLTKSLPIPIGDAEKIYSVGFADFKSRGLAFAAWPEQGNSVLVYDNYDLWQLDLSGKAAPVNLTGGYGRKHHIMFRVVRDPGKDRGFLHSGLLLSAFNTENKNNGFYRLSAGKKKDPELLTMGPFVYCTGMLHVPGFTPIKARDVEVYLVERQSTSESPNYFLTGDFKSFRQISQVYPEKTYNWMRSELVNFNTADGKPDQGVLYKPENFDPGKKYPVVIQYYERKSEYLNAYHLPETASDNIDVPWFVSNGYLVFTPDIHYTIGENGESALNAVTGGYHYLKTLPYVDSKKIGIQGHSFGGFETNYIITHTDLFAAALSAAGMSNEMSNYNELWGMGTSKQYYFEQGQGRMGATLWQCPGLYLKNSPILLADQITTPLLMMHNKEDGAVSFSQGMELFTALRRLGKRAWLLQYDKEVHNLFNPTNKKDYTIRMTQFFDHYLKGAPAPEWMLRGIPAKMKGVDDGLKLDTTGATPGKGLVTEEEQRKIDTYSKVPLSEKLKKLTENKE